jgi:hypothetical protein
LGGEKTIWDVVFHPATKRLPISYDRFLFQSVVMSTEGIGLHELWSITTSQFFAVARAKILKRELAFAIEKRSAATETRQLHVVSGGRFYANDFIICVAVRAAELGPGVWHRPE